MWQEKNPGPQNGNPSKPSGLGAFLLGSVTVSILYWARDKIRPRAPLAQMNELGDQQGDNPLDDPNASFGVIRSEREAVEGVSNGSFGRLVTEFGSMDGESFSYAFKVQNGSTVAAFPDHPELTHGLLRGIRSGEERDKLLEELQACSGQVQARVTQSSSSPSNVPGARGEDPWYADLALPIILGTAAVAAARYIGRGIGSIAQSFDVHAQSGIQKFVEVPEERFSDVGGSPTVLAEMKALVAEIERFQNGDPRAHLPRGVLMSGPPGTGKTFLGRVICGEVSCPMVYVNAADLSSSPFIGSWVASVKKMFAEARKLRDDRAQELSKRGDAWKEKRAVVVLFLDEFDSIARTRSSESQGAVDLEHTKAVNTLLAELDGVDSNRNVGIVIIAATNSYESIDSALKRPGRFALQLNVPLPATTEERFDVLKKVSARIIENQGVEMENESQLLDLAKVTGAISPDHLRGIVERAADVVRREDRDVVTTLDLFTALQEVLFGYAHDGLLVGEEKRRAVAWHEHGHGILGVVCGCAPLVISMRPRGESLGRVVLDSDPLTEPLAQREDLLKALLITAGGRAGEILGKGIGGVSAGVTGDFRQMEQIARVIIDNGLLHGGFGGAHQQRDFGRLPPRQRSQITNLCSHAIFTATRVLRVAQRETIEKAMLKSLELNHELVGEEARIFYEPYLTADQLRRMRALVAEFMEESQSFLDVPPPGVNFTTIERGSSER